MSSIYSTKRKGRRMGSLASFLRGCWVVVFVREDRRRKVTGTEKEKEDERGDYRQESFTSNLYSFVFLDRREKERIEERSGKRKP